MTTVPRSSPKKNDTRTYSYWEWIKAYAAYVVVWPIFALAWVISKLLPTLPAWLTMFLFGQVTRYMLSHKMDFRIPPNDNVAAYMHRWWWLPRNAFFNIYLHRVLRSDDDRALHDHPWMNISIVLSGGYTEHTIGAGGVHHKKWFGPGSLKVRTTGKYAHRLELDRTYHYNVDKPVFSEKPAVTIFITGPVLRRWGFHDPERWVDAYDWDTFNDKRGVVTMNRMDGGSDAAVSERNKL